MGGFSTPSDPCDAFSIAFASPSAFDDRPLVSRRTSFSFGADGVSTGVCVGVARLELLPVARTSPGAGITPVIPSGPCSCACAFAAASLSFSAAPPARGLKVLRAEALLAALRNAFAISGLDFFLIIGPSPGRASPAGSAGGSIGLVIGVMLLIIDPRPGRVSASALPEEVSGFSLRGDFCLIIGPRPGRVSSSASALSGVRTIGDGNADSGAALFALNELWVTSDFFRSDTPRGDSAWLPFAIG